MLANFKQVTVVDDQLIKLCDTSSVWAAVLFNGLTMFSIDGLCCLSHPVRYNALSGIFCDLLKALVIKLTNNTFTPINGDCRKENGFLFIY